MGNVKIVYVAKDKLYPAFGDAGKHPPSIRIRKDLPKVVQKFILEHERYHVLYSPNLETRNNWIWEE